MAGEYDTVPLGDVASVRSGFAFKSSDWSETGIPVVKIANIKGGNLVMDGCSFVPQAIADSAGEFTLQAGDILIAMTGYIGDVAIVRERDLPAVLNQRVGRFSIRDPLRLDPRFLFYVLRDHDVRKEIESLGYGSAQPNVSPSLIHSVEIPLPPLPEQRAIAHILGTLDDKIELNRRMSETLEAMARALFKAWFVDFEPVRAKMEGRWQRGNPLPPHPEGEGRGEGSLPTKSHARLPSDLLAFARELRQNETDAERLLWRLLRNRSLAGAKFRRQHPFPPYVLDFYCHELKLAIELDGGQHNLPEGRLHDKVRTAKLAEHGIRVLRFWNHEVLRDTESVLEAIYQAIVERREELRPSPPAPLPAGEGSMVSGLPAHLYDLFPDRLVDSELGEIPEGWEVKSLDEIAHFLNGLALQKYPPKEGRSLPVIKIAQLRSGNTLGADQASADLDPDYVVADGDILFSWSGSLECVVWAGGPGALNQHLFKVTPKRYPRWLCYFGVHAHLEEFRHVAAGKATTMGHIQRHHLSEAKLAVPPSPLLEVMDRCVSPIFEASWKRHLESRTLAALRDALLPKLIRGEIRVKDAERFLKEREL